MDRLLPWSSLLIIFVIGSMSHAQLDQPNPAALKGPSRFQANLGHLTAAMSGISDTAPSFALRHDVVKELELTEDQVARLQALHLNAPSGQDILHKLGIVEDADIIKLAGEEREQMLGRVRQATTERRRKLLELVKQVLTRQQIERLKELRVQFSIMSRRISSSSFDSVGLTLDPRDIQRLRKRLLLAEKEVAEELVRIRREKYLAAAKEVIGDLEASRMLGDEFAFDLKANPHPYPRPGELPDKEKIDSDKIRQRTENPRRNNRRRGSQ